MARLALVAAVVAVAALLGVACESASAAEVSPKNVIEVLRVLSGKSADDIVDAASKRASENADRYAAELARQTDHNGPEVAEMLMRDAVLAGKYARTTMEELAVMQRRLLDRRARLAEDIRYEQSRNYKRVKGPRHNVEDMLATAPGSTDETIYTIAKYGMDGPLPNSVGEYIKMVVGMAQLDKVAEHYAKKSGESLPVALQRIPSDDAIDLLLLRNYIARLKRINGKVWTTRGHELMSVQDNIEANQLLEILKSGDRSAVLTKSQTDMLQWARAGDPSTEFERAVRAVDPGPGLAPYAPENTAKYGYGIEAIRKEFDDLAAVAPAVPPAALKKAVAELGGPLDKPLSAEAIEATEDVLRRADPMAANAGEDAATAALSATDAHVFRLANARMKRLFDTRAEAVRQHMPEDGRAWFDFTSRTWSKAPPRDVKVAAFLKDLHLMHKNAETLEGLARKKERAAALLSLATGTIKPKGWFKESIPYTNRLGEYLTAQAARVDARIRSAQRLNQQRVEIFASDFAKDTGVPLPDLNRFDLEALEVITAQVDNKV